MAALAPTIQSTGPPTQRSPTSPRSSTSIIAAMAEARMDQGLKSRAVGLRVHAFREALLRFGPRKCSRQGQQAEVEFHAGSPSMGPIHALGPTFRAWFQIVQSGGRNLYQVQSLLRGGIGAAESDPHGRRLGRWIKTTT